MKLLKRLLMVALLIFLSAGTLAGTTRITFLHSDATGSPVAATNEAGAVIWRKTYAPYGKASNKDGDNRIGYTGHVEDQNGLIYAGARYYDPTLGRFLSDDPVRFSESNPMSFNRFAYANDNPYRFIDPTGMAPDPETLAAAGETSVPGEAVITVAHNIQSESAAISEASTTEVASVLLAGPEGKVAEAVVGKIVSRGVAKSASREITDSSRKRVKQLIKGLSDNSRQNDGLSQEKTDQLRRIVEKAGGTLRNDGSSGVKGSSAGKSHVQTEGLGSRIDSRHIWTQDGVE